MYNKYIIHIYKGKESGERQWLQNTKRDRCGKRDLKWKGYISCLEAEGR